MIIFFNPVLFDKVWGGNKIGDFLGYNVSNTCGECWGISAHKNGECSIKNGIYKDKTLKYIFDNHKDLFGFYEGKEFPILIKIVDAKSDLSIQVHPDDEYAKKFNSYGKTECWYILENEPDAELIIGHNFKTKEDLVNKINNNDFINHLNRVKITKGDYYFINSGTLHAICAGITLLEVQQSSDITYRIYDYNRLDKGKLRELHVKDAIDVIKVPDSEVITSHNNKYFDYLILHNQTETVYHSHLHGDYIVVLEGLGEINNQPIKKGDFLMVSSNYKYTLKGNLKIQKTWF